MVQLKLILPQDPLPTTLTTKVITEARSLQMGMDAETGEVELTMQTHDSSLFQFRVRYPDFMAHVKILQEQRKVLKRNHPFSDTLN